MPSRFTRGIVKVVACLKMFINKPIRWRIIVNQVKCSIKVMASRLWGQLRSRKWVQFKRVTFHLVNSPFLFIFLIFCRADLRGASEYSYSGVVSLRQYQSSCRDRKLISDMDRNQHQTNAQCNQLLHRQLSCCRCDHRNIRHSLSIPSCYPTAMGLAVHHVSFLSLHSNHHLKCFNIHPNGNCHRQTQGNFEPTESSIIKIRL